MGTFFGHLAPGVLLIMVSVWWAFNLFRYFLKSTCKNGLPFVAQPWFPGPFCTKFPFESLFKIVMSTISIIGVLIDEYENGVFDHVDNAQHIIMFFVFGFSGAMDMLKYCNFDLPNGIEAATGMMAYGIEGFLIYNHLHGRHHMDIQVHMFLFYVVVMCFLSVMLEVWHPEWVMASLSRAYFTLMQGTWCIQVGTILYPPFVGMQPWDKDSHEQMMIVILIYMWHCAINMIIMLLIGAGVYICMKGWRLLDEANYRHLSMTSTTISPSKMSHMNGRCKNSHI